MADGGKVVLITGASSGIGKACAEQLAKQGFVVFAAARSLSTETEEIAQGLRSVHMDVDDDVSVREGVDHILRLAGRLEVVVNCAGFGIGGPIEDTSIEEARQQFDTNFFGVFRVCKAALPTFRSQASGRIVNVSSIAGRIAVPFQGFYSATKYAIEGLTEALRMEVKPFGVHVSLIEPGDFRTGFTEGRQRVGGEARGAYADRSGRAMARAAADEMGGSSPDRVARLLVKILKSRNPKLRYTVGPLSQRLSAIAKPFLPPVFVEHEVMKHYEVL
jgi:NAD(P)-dependent dehydrogenase (short-subunit alcohol dehydrogenase family)